MLSNVNLKKSIYSDVIPKLPHSTWNSTEF